MGIERVFEVEGLRAVIAKNDSMGHLCGYIGVPEGHPLHGKSYDEVDIQIHGGWTYGDNHVPFEAPDGNWYFGFDCAHAGDLIPGIARYYGDADRTLFSQDVYRDEAYVERELREAAPHFAQSVG